MDLYIKVENGNCVNHPAFGNNLIEAFGKIPPDWEPFERREPVVGEYEVLVSMVPTYQKVDGVWIDVWEIRPMTDDERAEKDRLASTTINTLDDTSDKDLII